MKKLILLLLVALVSCMDDKDPLLVKSQASNEIEKAKAWFLNQDIISTSENARPDQTRLFDKIGWEETTEIKLANKLLFEIPVYSEQKVSFKQGTLEINIPIKRVLLINKTLSTNG